MFSATAARQVPEEAAIADIFISYRHGRTKKKTTDGWAASLLREKLHDGGFPTFFDARRDALDLGDDFTRRIAAELAECQVVFAVIGPDWLQAIPRLHGEEDWVRRELVSALSDAKKKVVPLLLGSDQRMPEAALLPSVLHPLLNREGMSMDVDGFPHQAEHLVGRVREWLKRPAFSATSAPQPPVPDGLPFLCDRVDQEIELVKLLTAAAKTPAMAACVVHGHKFESHDELLERFVDEGTIASGLRCEADGILASTLRPGREKLRRGEFLEAMKLAFKAGVLDDPGASDSELCEFFVDLPVPLVAELQITWRMLQESAPGLVNGLVNAWKALPTCDGSSERQKYTALLWINLTYEDLETELAADALAAPLPKLPSLDEQDVRDWLRLTKVRPHAERKKRELLAILEDPHYRIVPGRVHMMRFADAFKTIMSTP